LLKQEYKNKTTQNTYNNHGAPQPMPKKIFISHTTADDTFVTDLRKALENQGLDVWIDSQNLRGGDTLKTEIESAITNADAFIVVISPKVFNSTWVRQEILFAQKHVETIVPILIEGMKPPSLLSFFCRPYVNFFLYWFPSVLAPYLIYVDFQFGLRFL
jgi:TIR domain.